MRRLLAVLLTLAALAGTPAAARSKHGGAGRSFADPSSIAAVEIAFNRLAREKGQWTAFREYAAPEAVMFVPQRVLAQDWLKKRPDPSAPVQWQPQRIYMSCDGRTAASTGAWQRPDGTTGYFTTIWQLQDKGGWKWVLDHGDALATPLPSADFLEGHVAVCRRGGDGLSGREAGSSPAPQPSDGRVRVDASLLWSYDVHDDGSREVSVQVWNGTGYDRVIDDHVKAGG